MSAGDVVLAVTLVVGCLFALAALVGLSMGYFW